MRHYLTNMHNSKKELVYEAIEISGRRDIHVSDQPAPGKEFNNKSIYFVILKDYFSIYVDSECDCSDFWRVYRKLEKTPRWQIYFNLINAK